MRLRRNGGTVLALEPRRQAAGGICVLMNRVLTDVGNRLMSAHDRSSDEAGVVTIPFSARLDVAGSRRAVCGLWRLLRRVSLVRPQRKLGVRQPVHRESRSSGSRGLSYRWELSLKRVWCVAAALVLTAARPVALLSQGTLVVDSVFSRGLQANVVGDSPIRRVLVYLPPSYPREPARRYPVLYMLHGATSTPEEWLTGVYQGMNFQLTLDSLIAVGAVPEFIVVMPDANNALEAGFYANSPATGNWQDFVVQDLLRHVDGRYRTDTTRAHRALYGHSMGGFGALAIGFEHPNVFGLVYAASPCCIGFLGRLAQSAPGWPALSAVTSWKSAPDRVRLILGMAAALDGSKSDPRLFTELPFRTQNGTVVPNEAARSRWLARMPPDLASTMVRRRGRAPAIHLEAGSQETEILAGIRLLRDRLDSLRIPYSDTVFVGGHIDRVRDRFSQHLLPMVGRWFDSTLSVKRNPVDQKR